MIAEDKPEGTIRVIHIDDEDDQLVLAKLFLEQSDPTIKVTSTQDPQKVLELVREGKHDCIISDYSMPKINGIQLASKIRGFSDILIIIYTGQGSEEVAEAAFYASVDDYLRKEVDPSHYQMLAKRIRNNVDKKRVKKKLKILIDNIPDVFYIADQNGATVFVSPNVSKMAGYTADEISKPDPNFWFTIVYHEDMDTVKEGIRAYIEEDVPYDVEYRIQRKDGTWVWVHDRATQKYEMEGVTYFDGKLSDISEQKLMEKGLKGYTEYLEQMVQDLKVYSKQLEDTVKERNRLLVDAERNIAVGQVASMVGHDLRGPLQTINNAIYLMQRDPEKQGNLVKTIKSSVQYAVQILEDLRNSTRDTPLQIQEFNLGELIELIMRGTNIPNEIEVKLGLGYGLERVHLDVIKIRRIMDNLVRNAYEAIEGEGTIIVRALRQGNDIVIEVTDTGSGIPEESMPNLFQTFKTTKKKGLGLGLAYTKMAVESHGGRIDVVSKVGEGTTFKITLPQPEDAGVERQVEEVDDSHTSSQPQ
ncbi:MAG: ATP-binding protein [Candidatus Bathyarchaeota archaeon]|nr:ATP-binding protein [Candidatus Bathyarchaeota archaeon]